jgi:hypothetical protein
MELGFVLFQKQPHAFSGAHMPSTFGIPYVSGRDGQFFTDLSQLAPFTGDPKLLRCVQVLRFK